MPDNNETQGLEVDLPTKVFFILAIVAMIEGLFWGISMVHASDPLPTNAVPVSPAAQEAAYNVADRFG